MKNGLIVSIQRYSQEVTQELALRAIDGGAVAIRTDVPIKANVPIIGLEKNNKEFFITTERISINKVMKWADYIAIDLRRGNIDIELLLAHCHVNDLKIVADIETIKDIDNLKNACLINNMKEPVYYATTFQYEWSFEKKKTSIDEIKLKYPNIKLIAEGGYSNHDALKEVNTDNICIGSNISDIEYITAKYKELLCC